MQRGTNIVRLIAVLTVITALYEHLPHYLGDWLHRVQLLLTGRNPIGDFPSWFIALGVLFDLVVLGKLVAGAVLLSLSDLARRLAVVVLSADVVVRFLGMVNAWTSVYREIEPPPEFQNSEVVVELTMMPTYAITLISLTCVVILTRKTIRDVFRMKTA